MCNGTCDICSKQANNLSDIGGSILSCPDPTTCENSTSLRKLSEWQLVTNQENIFNWSLIRKDIFGNVLAEVYRHNVTTLYCTVSKGDSVFLVSVFQSNYSTDIKQAYALMKQNKTDALTWCEECLKNNGYII